MSILVIGGTGTVGSETVRRLVAAGQPARVMIRSEDKARSLPGGAKGVVGDLARAETLPSAMEGVERLFLVTPLGPTEVQQGRAAVRAAQRAGVKRLVFMSVHDVEKAPHVPHFRSKIEIEEEIRDSGIPFTILMPNNFFQNDLWTREAIVEHGVYPQPLGGVGLSRVDVRDIADAAVNALIQEDHGGERYPVVGPEVLTGEDCARVWSRHLGRKIRYAGDDLGAWAAQARRTMPGWMVDDLLVMWRHFQESGLAASEDDLGWAESIVGRAPITYDVFVKEMAAAWA